MRSNREKFLITEEAVTSVYLFFVGASSNNASARSIS